MANMVHGGQALICKSTNYDDVITIGNHSVNKLSFGHSHGLLLTSSGQIYGFGDNDKSELGPDVEICGNELVKIDLPQCEELCENCRVVDIDCGPEYSAAVLNNGVVFMWGSSEYGQCGLESDMVWPPNRIEIIDEFKDISSLHKCSLHMDDCGSCQVPIMQIACGHHHTVALSRTNEVWVWGTGAAQLGLLGVVWSYKPLKVPFFESKRVLSISCGSFHNAAVVQKNNVVQDSPQDQFCLKCQFDSSKVSESAANSIICPLGMPLSSLSISNVTDDTKDDTIETELSADESTTNASLKETKVVVRSDRSPSVTSSIIDKENAEAFLSKQMEVDAGPKSMKETVLSATGQVVTDLCNTVSEKLEMLVQMRAPPSEHASNISSDGFEDISEEANALKRLDDSTLLRSSSLKVLEESNLLKNVYDRTSSSMDKLLLNNKQKYRSYSHDSVSVRSSHSVSPSFKAPIQTELWTWGKGRSGQLGHGDMLERLQPCMVQALCNKNIIKVVACDNHTVAMTTDCRIFTWGSNTSGQLGHSLNVPAVCNPQRIHIPGSTLVWDVAVNSNSTLFLANGPERQIGVYFCGRQSSSEEEPSEPCQSPQLLNLVSQERKICRIYANADYFSFISDQGSSDLVESIHQFAVSEKHFNYIIKMLSEEIFKSLLNQDIMKEDSTCIMALKVLICVHTELCDIISVNCFDLIQLLRCATDASSNSRLLDVYMIDESQDFIRLITRYVHVLCDCFAVDAFNHIIKAISSFFDQKRPFLNELYQMTASNTQNANTAVMFTHLVQLPCQHFSTYANSLSNIANQHKKASPECNTLQDLSVKLSNVCSKFKLQMTDAEKSLKFWESCPVKLSDALKQPERRFVKDSKSHPLVVNGGSRFTSHWFMLFNDVFIHSQFSGIQAYYLSTIWAEVLPDSETQMNSFSLTTPEETLVLSCPSAILKTEWICALNEGIKNALSSSCNEKKERRMCPPLARFATHVFTKSSEYKDATYSGMWLCAKLHGEGILEWPNGKKYIGKFKQNLKHGHGILTEPSNIGSSAYIVYEGEWKNGKLNGLASVKYPNGDFYEGYFKDDQRHGHGVLKKGQFLSTAASVYIGQWLNNVRHGYGVNDDVMGGEKYLGLWENDARHGNGIMVTIDGVYYEGLFHYNKMQGYGLVIFEDNTNYEGDLSGHGVFHGKGTMNLSNGDHIEGSFYGKWNDGVKINGVFHKSTNCSMHSADTKELLPKSFGKLCVPSDKKWESIFKQCQEVLGIATLMYEPTKDVTSKVWENIAVTVTNWKKILEQKHVRKMKQRISDDLHNLDTIPEQSRLDCKAPLHQSDYDDIKLYTSRAFECIYHPIGQMADQLVDVFRATYIGVGAHPKLLIHAVAEIRSYITRIYQLIRHLFPVLPKLNESPKTIIKPNKQSDDDDDDSSTEMVTPSSLLLPLLLPRIYSPLFMLYALENEHCDEKYWERLLKWNKQADTTLLSFLGVESKFWLAKDATLSTQCSSNNIYFSEAIETLQRLSTTFSPHEKLHVIHDTFQQINMAVEKHLGTTVLWTMDELFPVFQFTVVRARIRHLGSEVHFIDDFMEERLQHGELGIMLTTLKACYFQIQNEKVVNW